MERRKIEKVLVAIQEREQNISTIAKRSKVTKPTVRKIITSLQKNGHINLRKTAKYVYISITKQGMIEKHNLFVAVEGETLCQMDNRIIQKNHMCQSLL